MIQLIKEKYSNVFSLKANNGLVYIGECSDIEKLLKVATCFLEVDEIEEKLWEPESLPPETHARAFLEMIKDHYAIYDMDAKRKKRTLNMGHSCVRPDYYKEYGNVVVLYGVPIRTECNQMSIILQSQILNTAIDNPLENLFWLDLSRYYKTLKVSDYITCPKGTVCLIIKGDEPK